MCCLKVFVVTSLILMNLSCTNATKRAPGDQPESCHDVLQNNKKLEGKDGVYKIHVDGEERGVYCDMTTDGGGWTVIQRRFGGSEDFYQKWQQYKEGFGDPYTEYWIGNDAIHFLTNKGQMLRIELLSFDCEKSYATYSTFRVDSEKNKYKLTVSGFKGPATDSFGRHNGRQFSTSDNDNDHVSINCAAIRHGGWWYDRCAASNLNGQYFDSPKSVYNSMYWYGWKGYQSLKGSVMMVKPTA